MCGERGRVRERKGEKKKERIWGWGGGWVEWEIKRIERMRGKTVNDAALRRNVSNGRQFVPQVSNMVDVMVCQGDTKRCGRSWCVQPLLQATHSACCIHNIHLHLRHSSNEGVVTLCYADRLVLLVQTEKGGKVAHMLRLYSYTWMDTSKGWICAAV